VRLDNNETVRLIKNQNTRFFFLLAPTAQNRNGRRSYDYAIQIADPAPIFFSGDSEHDSARVGMGTS
jgi:hypothetical protein